MDTYLTILDDVVVPMVMAVAVIIIPLALLTSLLVYGMARTTVDVIERKKQNRKALIIFLSPIALVLVMLIVFAGSHIVAGIVGGPATVGTPESYPR